MHKCLRENRAKLSERCRAEEVQLAILESSNTELMPQLAKACKAERAAHCEGVRPGKARVFNCLLSHSDHVRPQARLVCSTLALLGCLERMTAEACDWFSLTSFTASCVTVFVCGPPWCS